MTTNNDSTNEAVTEIKKPNNSPIVIKINNPTAEEFKAITAQITANYNFKVNTKPVVFNFKKSKDKATGIETIRKPVELAIPYPSVEGIVDILESGGKGLELLIEAVEGIVNTAARELLYEDTKLNAANFPVEKVSWEAIANIPKAQRRGGGIPKEVWAEFAQDYVDAMPGITGKTIDAVANAAKLLVAKLQPVRTAEPILLLLVEQLSIYADKAPNANDYKECIEFLLNKADSFLNVSEEDLLANL